MVRSRTSSVRAVMLSLVATVALTTCKLDELTSPEELGRIVPGELAHLDSARVGSTARRVRLETLTLDGGTSGLGFSATVQGGSGWLKLDATRGSAPGTFGFALDPAGLPLGDHTDSLVLTSDAPDAAQVKVGVTFRIIGCRVDDIAALPAQLSAALTTQDCESPTTAGRFARLFRIAGTAGDSISIHLTSPSFAPVLSVSPDAEGAAAIAESDSCAVGEAERSACLRYLRLPEDGAYLVQVATAAARATGDLSLEVQRPQAPAVPTSLVQSIAGGAPLLIATGGSVTQPRVLLGASLADGDADQLRLEVELRPAADPFTGVATAVTALGAGPTFTVEQSDLDDDVGYHWRARAVDETGRASAWQEFGGNDVGAIDFVVTVADAPVASSALGQRLVGGEAIASGATITSSSVELQATVTDPDAGDQLRLEAEVRPLGEAFTGVATATGAPVSVGQLATVTVEDLADDVAYHWRVRSVDAAGHAGPWSAFGGGVVADFRVALPPERLAFVVEPSTVAAGLAITPGVRVAATDAAGTTRTSFEGPITIALAPGSSGVTLTGTLTVNAVDGIALFDALSVDVAGTYALVATAAALEATSASFTVGAGSAATIVFVDAPHHGTAGSPIVPAPQVHINDALGNLDLGFAGDVTLVLGANPAGGALSGITTVAASGGIATFSDVRIDRAGTGYTLIASSTGLALAETGPLSVDAGAAAAIAFVAEPSPTATSGAPLAVQPAVRLLDAFGNDVATAGQVVTATIMSGPTGASLANASATTDAAGVATFTGLAITGGGGSYALAFAVPGLTGVTSGTITLGAGAASQLVLVTAPSTSTRNGEAIPVQPAVRLRDASGNDVEQAGVAVSARIATGGGTLGGTTTVFTGADGIAAFAELSITGLVGARTIAFDADGLASVTSGAIDVTAGDATTIARASVEAQSAPVGTTVPVDPSVLVTDQSGNPVAGVPVTFSVTAGGGSLVPALAVATNESGLATLTSWTLGGVAGENAVSAVVDGLDGSPVTFTATGTAGAATAILIAGGDDLTGTVGSTLGTSHDVRIVDANGNPVAGVSVAWAAIGGGTVNPSLSVSGADGIASTVRTLGNAAGAQGTRATATVGGAPASVTFSIIATVGGATQMALVSGDAQAAVVATALAEPLVVRVRDAAGNVVPGVLVTWGVIDGGGSVAPTTSTTDANGLASTTWTLGNLTTATDSTQLARATAVGAPVNFVATSRPGPVDPAQVLVAVVPSSVGASRTAPVAVTVTARDAFGNPVPNQGVVLAASGTGNTLVQPIDLTAANGTTTGAFGSTTTGAHTISATVAGLAAVQAPVVTIVPAPAARLAFVTPPTDVTAGAVVAPAVVVELLDSLGNRATTSATPVTVSLATNPGATTLGGTLTRTSVAGLATFPDLTVPRAAAGYQLGATSGALTGVVSGAFDVSVGAVSPSRSSVSFATSPVVAGVAGTVTVTARDANDNPVAGVAVVLDALGDGVSLTQPLGVTGANGVATGAASATIVGAKSVGATVDGTVLTPRAAFTVVPAAVSATTSSIDVAPASISADGGSSTITVVARDAFMNVVPGATVVLAATGSDNVLVQPAVTNALGVATGSIASARAEAKVVSATIDGVALTSTAGVTVGVGAVSSAQSTITSDVATLTAGDAVATITVTARDAQGNPVAGVAVTLAATGTGNTVTPPALLTNALGVATGTVSSTIAGAKIVTATAGGTAVTQSATITVLPAGVSAATSSVIAEPTTVASGVASTIHVVARDAFGNAIAGAAVALAATGDEVTLGQPAVTDANGATQGTVSSTAAGTKTVTATIAGVTVTQTADVLVTAGAVSGTTSTVETSPTALTAGAGAATITVTARDADGNPVPGVEVTLAATGTDNALTQPAGVTDANGIATGTLASTRAEAKSVSATAGGVPLAVPAVVTVGPAALSVLATSSTVQLSSAVISADGVASSTITVTARDAFGNPIPALEVTLAATGDGNVITQPAAPTDAQGVATGSITSTVTGAKLISATVGSSTLDQQPTLTVTPDAASGTTSTLALSSGTVAAGDTITVTVTARDAAGNVVPGVTVAVTADGTGNTIIGPTAVTDASGVATARFTSTVAEGKVISASVNGTGLEQEGAVTVTPAAVSATTTTVIAAPTSIVAGTGSSTITVTARDEFANVVPGVTVSLATGAADATLTQPTDATGADGVATGAVSATLVGSKVVSATVDDVPITAQATVTVTPGVPDAAQSTVVLGAPSAVAGAAVSVTVTARDANGNVVPGVAVVISATGDDVTPTQPEADTDANGVATGSVAATLVGAKSISASVGGVPITTPAALTITPAAINALTSTVVVDQASISADGGSAAITVTVRDQFLNAIAGVDVVLAADGGTTGVTQPIGQTDANGVALGAFASTAAGPHAITASAGEVSLTNGTTVTVTPGAVSASTSTVSASPGTITAGTETSTITVTARDQHGNAIPDASVVLDTDDDVDVIVQPGATSGLGVTTGTVASTRAGVKVVSASVGGVALIETASVTVSPAALSLTSSTVELSPSGIVSDGATSSTITATLVDAFGNRIPGATVEFSANPSAGVSITQPTGATLDDGVATGTVTASTPGDRTIIATVGAQQLTQQPTLAVTLAAVDAAGSSVALSNANPVAGEQIDVTVTVRDLGGNLVPGATVSLGSAGANLTLSEPLQTDASGVAIGTFSSTSVQSTSITVTVGAVTLTTAPSVTIAHAALSDAVSTVVLDPTTIIADSIAASTITVTATDAFGNRISGLPVEFSAPAGVTLPAPTVTDQNGIASGTITATVTGSHAITATVEGTTLLASPTLTVTPTAVSPTLSTVQFSNGGPRAGEQVNVHITARDTLGNLVPNATVTVTSTGEGDTIGDVIPVTNVNGETDASFSSTRAGDKQLAVTINGVAVQPAPTLFVVAAAAFPDSTTIAPSASTMPAGGTVDLTVTVKDSLGNLAANATVEFAISAGTASFVGAATGTTNASGTFTGHVTATLAGQITVTTSLNGTPIGSGTVIDVTPGAATQLQFVSQPAGGPATTEMPAFTVAAQDEHGNVVSSFTGDVTIAITAGTGALGAVASGLLTVTAIDGVATFSGISIDIEGSGYSFTATVPGLTPAASDAFDIVPVPPPPVLSFLGATRT